MDSSVNFVRGRAHDVGWIIPITSAGITVMNDDIDSQLEEPSLVNLSHDTDEWDLPMLSTDFDGSFELVSSNAPEIGRHGPSQPLPKMKSHTRVVRPRMEPRRFLQNGVPTWGIFNIKVLNSASCIQSSEA